MAVEFAGGVVIGADSRTTTGSYIANVNIAMVLDLHCSVIDSVSRTS